MFVFLFFFSSSQFKLRACFDKYNKVSSRVSFFSPLLSCFFEFMSKRSCRRDYHLFDLQNRNGIAQRFSGTDLHKQHGETVMELLVLD